MPLCWSLPLPAWRWQLEGTVDPLGSFHSSRRSVAKPLGQFQEHRARCAGLLEGRDLIEGGAHLHTPCFLWLSPSPPSGHPAGRALHGLKKPKNQDATAPALVSSSDAGNQQSRWERCVREGNTFPPQPEAPIPALHSPHLEGQTREAGCFHPLLPQLAFLCRCC